MYASCGRKRLHANKKYRVRYADFDISVTLTDVLEQSKVGSETGTRRWHESASIMAISSSVQIIFAIFPYDYTMQIYVIARMESLHKVHFIFLVSHPEHHDCQKLLLNNDSFPD